MRSFFNSSQQQPDQDQAQMPSSTRINHYNADYSFILKQAEQFYSECKEYIMRYVMMNNIGAGFNLFNLYNVIIQVQSQSYQKTHNPTQEAQHCKYQNKKQHQLNFHQIMHKMGSVIQELQLFEIQFKQSYFSMDTQPKPIIQNQNSNNLSNTINSEKYKAATQYTQQTENEDQQVEVLQQKLRYILNDKLKPQKQKKSTLCTKHHTVTQNVQTLNQKMENIKNHIQNHIQKQTNNIKVFQHRRVQNIHRPDKLDRNGSNEIVYDKIMERFANGKQSQSSSIDGTMMDSKNS